MSIRLIAKELYRAQKKMESLEAELASAPYEKQDAIKDNLRKAKAEWQHIRRILDGEKAPSPFSKIPSTLKRYK